MHTSRKARIEEIRSSTQCVTVVCPKCHTQNSPRIPPLRVSSCMRGAQFLLSPALICLSYIHNFSIMTALLPPNLLKLFAPRPPVPYLKPLTRDEAKRGPNKLSGLAVLRQRLKEEADDDEIKQGLEDKPVTVAEGSKSNGAVTKAADGDVEMGEVKEDKEEVKEASTSAVHAGKNKKGKERKLPKQKDDKISRMGVVGQEARKMRAEERIKRKEQYKKDSEANCECFIPSQDLLSLRTPEY